MKYKDEIIKSMEWLAEKEDTTFIGQSVLHSGNAIYNTLKTIDEEKRIEVPVFEEIQMGMCTGMALNGLVPICCFPRFDFWGQISSTTFKGVFHNFRQLFFKNFACGATKTPYKLLFRGLNKQNFRLRRYGNTLQILLFRELNKPV